MQIIHYFNILHNLPLDLLPLDLLLKELEPDEFETIKVYHTQLV